MNVELKYGKTDLKVNVPDKNVLILEQQKQIWQYRGPSGIKDALLKPIGSKPLHALAKNAKSAAIIFSDITRPVPYKELLPDILAELRDLPKEKIVLINALGTHRKSSAEELREHLGALTFDGYRIHQHDCDDDDNLLYLGRSHRDTRILVNKLYCQADIRVLTGFIEPHLFAGFSGGPKAVLPGVAGRETIHANHGPDMIASRGSGFGITYGNPIWEEMMEAALLTRPTFIVNTTQAPNGEITGVFTGDLVEAHRAGVEFAKQSATIPVHERFDIVITTASGYPLDINLYQAIKGLAVAGNIVKDGGAIILAAACEEGLPDYGEYADVLETSHTPQELLSKITSETISMQDQWDAQIQAQICSRSNFFIYSEGLSDDEIKKAFGIPCRDIEGLLDDLLSMYGDLATIAVVPYGPQSIPYIDPD